MLRKPPKIQTTKSNFVLTPEQREQIKQLRMEGMKLEWLAAEFGVTAVTIHRVLKKLNTAQENSAILQIQEGETDGTERHNKD